jgi:hypothetical protein
VQQVENAAAFRQRNADEEMGTKSGERRMNWEGLAITQISTERVIEWDAEIFHSKSTGNQQEAGFRVSRFQGFKVSEFQGRRIPELQSPWIIRNDWGSNASR